MAQPKKGPTNDEQRAAFLESLAETASITAACESAELPRRTAYNWRKDDEGFAEAWEESLDAGTDALEDEAVRRAHEGVEEPVFYQGEEVARVRKYSDNLLMFLLKGRRPERFRERTEVTGQGGGPVTFEMHLGGNG